LGRGGAISFTIFTRSRLGSIKEGKRIIFSPDHFSSLNTSGDLIEDGANLSPLMRKASFVTVADMKTRCLAAA
jgi:hypothetical protein